mmetsp:Transcript_19798/g.24143  ORF Transcript_19798/g.24143 Transcript_19798/m.24143 type:complete len:541 (-) Transcript_19798:1776-3398(-)
MGVAKLFSLFWAVSLTIASAKKPERFLPHALSFASLSLPSKDSERVLFEGLTETGIVVVNSIPDFQRLREEVLISSAKCALSSRSADLGAFRTLFEDGTMRYTLGSKTVDRKAYDFDNLDTSSSACATFESLSTDFRNLVNTVSQLFINRLDEALGIGYGSQLLLDTSRNQYFDTVKEVVETGLQLEHFHTYQRMTFPKNSTFEHTLDMHVDLGLFISMTPGYFVEGQEDEDSGLYIKLRTGDVVKPDFLDGNVLLFMIGDGFNQWINPSIKFPLRATPHAMKMPSGAATRSWYGRMFMPSDDAYLLPQRQTFRKLREEFQTNDGQSRISTTACSDGLVPSKRSLQTCTNANQIYCWNECHDVVASCGTGETTQCAKDLGGGEFSLCPIDTHDPGCQPNCLIAQSLLDIGNGFCNGFTVSMYMDGFTGVGDSKLQCLVFLFQSAVLDTAGKYTVAALCSVVLGIIVEFTVYLRRKFSKKHQQGLEVQGFNGDTLLCAGYSWIFGYADCDDLCNRFVHHGCVGTNHWSRFVQHGSNRHGKS